MKKLKIILVISACSMVLNIPSFSQEVTLPEVRIVATNYKYIKSISDTNAAQPVNLLQRRAAAFDVKNSEYYEEEYDNYFISFFIPDGEILAVYDQNGKILHTAEKFKNVALPPGVRKSVTTRFPGWAISKDVYVVQYSESEGGKKVYKLLLENGDKRIRVKTDEKGGFL
ncbi:MAG: nicotinate-nucleotide adenylyltransferase [Bacteroidota bacterium]|nr:nicotinate-nucleotide adenylyltransferase [Bacteroidota bacterium]